MSPFFFHLSLILYLVHMLDDTSGIIVHGIMPTLLVSLLWVQILYGGAETLHKLIPGDIYTVGNLCISLGNYHGLFMLCKVSRATRWIKFNYV